MTDVTDSFTGTTNTQLTAYSSNWTKATATDPDIQSNQLAADSSGNDTFCYWNADDFEDNQYCQIDRTGSAAVDAGVGPAVRMDSSGHCYFAYILPDNAVIYLYDGGFSNVGDAYTTMGNATYRLTVSGTTLSLTKNGSSSGMPSGTDSTYSSGSCGVHAYDDSATQNLADNWLAGPITVTGATLTVADAACVTQTDAVALTQAHSLTVNDGASTTQTDAVALVQNFTLAVNDTACTTQADAVTLTQAHSLTVTDAACTTQTDAVTVTQVHNLTAADAASETQADNITLAQVHNLAVNDAASTTQADNVTLSAAIALVVADAACTTQTDAVTIAQVHNLALADAAVTTQTDNVDLVYTGALVVANAACVTQTDALTLTQLHNLAIADASAVTQVDEVILIEYIHLPPASDSYVGNWTTNTGATSNLYQAVDEALAANDSDYIQSEQTPSASPVVLALTAGSDPISSDGHVLRYRYALDGSGTINLTVQLRQGYVDEASPGTLIAEWTHNGIGAITTAEQTLSGAQADSISNYGSLFVRMVATEV